MLRGAMRAHENAEQPAPRKTLDQPSANPARAIVFLSLAAFASAATTRICDGLLPQIADDFSVTTGAAAGVITAYSATYGLLQIAYGIVGDRFGKARVIVFCAFASLLATIACAAAASLGQLMAARLFAGAAAAAIVPMSLAWIGDNVPYRRRQAILARFMTGQISGVIAGLAFSGLIGQAMGWRAAFYMITAMYVIATTGLVFQFGREMRLKAFAPAAPVRTGALILSLFRRPWVVAVLAMTALEGFFCFGALAYVTSMLHLEFGIGIAAAGLTLGAFGAGGFLYAAIAPRVVASIGEAGGARAGGICFALAFCLFAVMPAWQLAILASFLAGLGYYCLHNVLQVNATQMAADARGLSVALFATSFFVGQGIGVATAAPIVDRFGTAPVFTISAIALPVCAFVFARAAERRS